MKTATVLIVEDDPDTREMLGKFLELEGFQVETAANGQQALDRLENGAAPGVIVLDLMMPVMDGWEFAQRLRTKTHLPRIPIIVLSADRNVSNKAAEIGAVGHLAKPFELNDLLDMVRRAFR